MRVLHLSTSSLASLYYGSLHTGLRRRGIEVWFGSLLVPERPGWLGPGEGDRYVWFGARSRRDYPRAFWRLLRYLRAHRFDIVHLHLFDGAALGTLATRLVRPPFLVLSRHHLDENYLLGTKAHVAIDGWTARVADRVLVPSEAVRRHMREVERLDVSNVDVVPIGFDFSGFRPAPAAARQVRRELGLDGAFVLGNVGRLFKNKGHEFLFAAVRELAASIPELRVLILGSGDRAFVEGLAVQAGVRDRVVFAGYRTDVAICMQAMDVLVHPSLSESFGQVIVEAMAVGTPVVATAVGGVPEIVIEGTGLLVPARDAGALAAAVKSLHRDPALRAQLGRAGQQSVLARFGAEHLVDAHFACYQALARRTTQVAARAG